MNKRETVFPIDLHWAPAWQVRDAIIERRLSATEVTRHFIARIAALDPAIHSFITVAEKQALAQAEAIDQQIQRGERVGPLAGVPISIKDQFWTRGIRTTGGSRVYADHVPEQDSIHVARLRAAGGIIIGKTNTPEFGTFWRTVNRVAKECVNPWDVKRTSGGSSGGAAASVAAGFGPLALGSDSGGSIRLPSAMCGVLGVLPSNGRVPSHGCFGSSTLFLSGVGPIARDVRDAATFLQLVARPWSADPLCRTDEAPDLLASLDFGVAGLRVGWWEINGISGLVEADVIAATRKAALGLESLGARFNDSVVLETAGLDEAWKVLDFVDRYAALGEKLYADAALRSKLSPYARVRFAEAKKATAAQYSRAVLRRAEFIRAVEKAFENCDVLLAPTVGYVAPVIKSVGPTERIPALVAYTLAVNVAGYTAASIPCGVVRGMPVGLQVIARPNQEALLLRVCRAFELAWPWAQRKPRP
ncbi:amidase [Bradyrhizobium sp. BR 1432]|uniref:amidase n=1 Tax=Bradyrhizobium sp. BR 1432 TaxID=3447966 RepID=UPI003EE4A728